MANMLTCHLQFKMKCKTMSFLICEDKTFATSVYHKPTFSGVYTHFDSFLPSTYQFGTVTHSLIDACEFALVGPKNQLRLA